MKPVIKEISELNPGEGLSFINTLKVNQDIGYPQILEAATIPFFRRNNLLQVGPEIPLNGWVLYISIIRPEMVRLLNILLPELTCLNLTFTLPENSTVQSLILDGSWGTEMIGKVICIYLKNGDNAQEIASKLINLTKPFSGPAVRTAFFLGGCVYTNNSSSEEDITGWPFGNIVKPFKLKEKRKIKHYLFIDQLKGDAKGDVYKCLNLERWLNIQWCVIKKGNRNHCADDTGRTVKDRLKWQFDLLNELYGLVPVPKPLDYFEYEGDTYLVIEFIKGVNLYERSTEIQQGEAWFSMASEAKRKILRIILETLKVIGLFHNNGIIHRDINPVNFLLSEGDRIVALDTELAYNFVNNKPSPPFTFGTNGYISPQQRQLETPVIADDIFGLGALIFKLMTNISPGKLSNLSPDQYFKNLHFFIRNNAVAAMITSCKNLDSSERPTLASVRHTLEVYDALLLNQNSSIEHMRPEPDKTILKDLIQRCINAYAIGELCDLSGRWIAKLTDFEPGVANEFKNYGSGSGFASGAAGVLYVVALAEKTGFHTASVDDNVLINYHQAINEGNSFEQTSAGLFEGKAGMSIAANKLIDAGLLENNIHNQNLIYQNLKQPVNGNNLASGSSGLGVAYLINSGNERLPGCYNELCLIVNDLIVTQNSDGSWLVKHDEYDRKGIKLYGFSYGISGIIYFLLLYFSRYDNQRVKKAIIRGLEFLLKARKKIKGTFIWPISAINDTIDPWFEHGFTGIALTFIRAYDILGEISYKEAAVTALNFHPQFISSNYLTVANGIAGLGEVYLEAFKTFKEPEWKERANHIVNTLLNCYWENTRESVYWLDGNNSRPGADFMGGNSGILHFLLHYLKPEKIDFPLQ